MFGQCDWAVTNDQSHRIGFSVLLTSFNYSVLLVLRGIMLITDKTVNFLTSAVPWLISSSSIRGIDREDSSRRLNWYIFREADFTHWRSLSIVLTCCTSWMWHPSQEWWKFCWINWIAKETADKNIVLCKIRPWNKIKLLKNFNGVFENCSLGQFATNTTILNYSRHWT